MPASSAFFLVFSVVRANFVKLSVGLMVDGNSRFALVEVLKRTGMSPEDLANPAVRDGLVDAYCDALREVYVRNARWCVQFGEELLSRVEGSDYTIFIYNVANRKRDHFSCIDHAICAVSGELIARLGQFGPVCLVGPEEEKQRWFSMFPGYEELSPVRGNENRSVLLMGYQRGIGEDGHASLMRPLDYFLRSTQMRFSGMTLSALDNSQLLVMSHIPYLYSARSVADALIEQARLDEEHDELNLYSPRIYREWMRHYSESPSIFFSSNALPPRMGNVAAGERAEVSGRPDSLEAREA